jgi:hypothetical protein
MASTGESYGSSGATGGKESGGFDFQKLLEQLFQYNQQNQNQNQNQAGGGAGNQPNTAAPYASAQGDTMGEVADAIPPVGPLAFVKGGLKIGSAVFKKYAAIKAAKRARDEENAARRRNALIDRTNYEQMAKEEKQQQLSNAFKAGEYGQSLGKNIWENYGRYT